MVYQSTEIHALILLNLVFMTQVSFPSKLSVCAWETIYWEQWSPVDFDTQMVVLTPPLKSQCSYPPKITQNSFVADHYLTTDPGDLLHLRSLIVYNSCRLYTPLPSLSLWPVSPLKQKFLFIPTTKVFVACAL